MKKNKSGVGISVVQQFGTRLSKAESNDFLDLLVEKLRIAIKENQLLTIDLDGSTCSKYKTGPTYSNNFLENSFGSLCKLNLFSSTQILGHIKLVSDDHELIKNIQRIIGDALGWPRFFYLYMPDFRQ
jgi:hypothetical protein